MNVVHLNASDQRGGAALAVRRLHRALRAAGVGSHLLVREKGTFADSVAIAPAVPEGEEQHRHDVIRQVYRDRNRSEVSNSHFSISLGTLELFEHPVVRAADVIHLHWVASLLSPAGLRRLFDFGKPIVWTLHDFAPFTGGCHFPAGCRGFQNDCSDCPHLRNDPFGLTAAVLRDKRDLWPVSALTLVAPSRWIAEQARRSTLFGAAAPARVIPNGIDPDVFRTRAQSAARKALGIPESGLLLLCGADHPNEKRKGFGLLRQVLDECSRDPRFRSADVRILQIGDTPSAWTDVDWPCIRLGRLEDEEGVALACAAADMFVLPSSEDNLPNMVLEAMACGRPVLAFDVGGVPEIVEDGWNGRVVPAGDVAAMAEAVLSLASDAALRAGMGDNARRFAAERLSDSAQARAHVALYDELLNRPVGTVVPPRHLVEPGPAVAALLPELTIHCLHQQLREAESDRAARGQVIEMMQDRLGRLEAECAARLRVIEELDAHIVYLRADAAARCSGYEARLKPFRWLENALSVLGTLWRRNTQ